MTVFHFLKEEKNIVLLHIVLHNETICIYLYGTHL